MKKQQKTKKTNSANPRLASAGLLGTKEVCADIGYSIPTISRWVSDKKFPAPRKINRRLQGWTPAMITDWKRSAHGRSALGLS